MNDHIEDSKLQAAYALNLCTVSVSQIIDYDDSHILEHEYNAILNNLNLQNMPHDEALLNILKQILDTITFFRLQEGDRKIMDMRYRQKMRNAIWGAAPNFGLIVAGGNPITIAVSLASQIGIGYMNYRKNKAENNLEYEEQQWRLQRAAIEQLNGLQRELLDTAWRLADTYGFDDEYRLSENQIRHYDSILMDENTLRRYDRLDSIKNKFVAYPPFWYFLGNTANEIARDESLSLSEGTRQVYRERAKEHFKQFWDSNKYPLLREDQLASSCALEYADLLLEEDNKESAVDLIDKAVKFAGNSWDILQLSAVGYLRANVKERAVPALKVLVNEKYNSSVNAQILSGIYIDEYVHGGNKEAKVHYESLTQRVNNKMFLIPWPTDGNNYEDEFYNNQRELLIRRYKHMINSYRDRFIQNLNMIIPIPIDSLEGEEIDYSDASREERIRAVERVLASQNKQAFLEDLNDISYGQEYINLMNRMLSSLTTLSSVTDIDKLVEVASKKISNVSSLIEKVQKKMREYDFTDEDYASLQDITSEEFLSPIFSEIKAQIETSINKMSNMEELSIATTEMAEFCNEEGLPLPDSKEDRIGDNIANPKTQALISYDVLGEKEDYFSKVFEKKAIMDAIIKKKLASALTGSVNLIILYPGTDAFNDYFKKSNRIVKKYKNEVLAILDDKSFLFDTDILLTTTSMLIIERNTLKEICSYDSVEYDSASNKLTLGNVQYHNANIDSAKMNEALIELKQACAKR